MKKIFLLALLAFGSFTLCSTTLFAATLGTTASVPPVETGVGETKTMDVGQKTTLTAGPETRFSFGAGDPAALTEKVTLNLEKGDVTVKVKIVAGKRVQLKIMTPNLVAKATAGEFQVLHDSSLNVSQVKVTKGTITLTDEKGKNKKIVRKGYETTVDQAGKPTKPIKFHAVVPAPALKSEATDFATFTFGTGVSAEEQAIIRKGIADMNKYFVQWFGRGIKVPVAVRVTADTSSQGAAHVSGGASDSKIQFHTRHGDWGQAELASLLFTDLRPQLVMHELVHTYQTEYGCGRQDQPVALRWLMEGMAEWLSFRAMIEAGTVTEAKVMDYNVLMNSLGKAGPLSSYEISHGDVGYDTFYLAVDQLVKKNSIQSLNAFCEDLGKGQSKTEAFQSAFGTSLSQFYTDFEGYRKGL